MGSVLSGHEALKNLFAALTETTFQVELGVCDTRLTDYLAELLARFVRMDAIYRFRDTAGRRLEEVAEMLMEAEQRIAHPQRELYRHIGDYTLFWTGVYPEALGRLQSPDRQDHLINYCEQGKRSYYIASTFDEDPYEEEAVVLRRLSDDFEMCTYGLNRVRGELENLRVDLTKAEWGPEQN
ncbi:MAG: hypothetical protein ACREJB_13815 [Planctomycetaceae bacterium]